MSYIVVDDGRYIGEHKCPREHYGDETVIRPECMDEYIRCNELVRKVALTRSHPAYHMTTAAWNHLTNAEMVRVPRPFDPTL